MDPSPSDRPILSQPGESTGSSSAAASPGHATVNGAESLYASLVENLPIYVLRKDTHGRITYVNQRLADLLGQPPDQLVGKTDFDLFPEALARKYRNDDMCVMQTGELFIDVEENVAGGSKVYFEVRKTPVKNDRGRIVGTQAIFWDVTEKTCVEEALKHERFLLHTLMDHLPDCIYFKDAESRFIRTSREMAKRFGAERPEEMVGKSDAAYFGDEHAHEAREDEQRVMQTGTPILGKIERETWADGHETWSSATKLPLKDDQGNIIGTFGVSRDVTDRVKAEQALSRERDLLKILIDHLPDLIYVKNAEGKYIIVNEAVRQLLGLDSVDAMIGRTNEDFLHPEQVKLEQADDRHVFTTGESLIEREERMVNHDGNERWMLTSKAPFHDADGNIIGLVGIDRNITRLKHAAAELQAARDAADAANRAKSDFLANVSHEIRTPMNAIIGMTDLLLDTGLNETQHEYLMMVQQSGESLLSLIDDILDYSKIEAGKLELDEETFELREGIGDMMKSLALRAHAKGLELAFHVDADIPDRLQGDLGRLRQILINLVGNAIKFTEAGEVVLDVSCGHMGDNRHIGLSFCVSDTGIGISADQRSRIFKQFEQADTSITRRFGGTGLGLAISSKLVSMMGGELDVHSTEGVGSEFTFTIRLALADETVEARPPATRLVISDTTVLVVDDNATNLRILQELLSNWGMRPKLTHDANAALRLLQQAQQQNQPIPLVVSDVNMPGMDGFSLVEKIHELPHPTRPAIILLTSGARLEDFDKWKRLGVSAHLMKPIKQSELFETIVSALHLVVPDRPRQLLASRGSASSVRRLRILLAEDNIVNQKLATAALDGLGHEVCIAHNGRQAIEFLQREKFDVVLMDLQMPEMDGLTATEEIRRREQTGRLPGRQLIVAMTAHAMKGDREMCLQAGMDDYVSKPIRMQDLSGLLARLFAAPTDDTAAEASSAQSSYVNWGAALQGVNGNLKLLDEVVVAFLDDVPRLLQQACQAHRDGDRAALVHAAHSLKGSMLFLEAEVPIEVAQDLELRAHHESMDELAPTVAALSEHVERLLSELRARTTGDESWQKC